MARDKIKQAIAKHNWYLKNKDYVIRKAREDEQKKKQFVREAKNKPCLDCKILYPYYVMQFDHRDGKQKELEIANMVNRGYGLDRIKKEIEKCDVVCANCHTIRTHNRSHSSTDRVSAF